jgi:hypothetical protein
MCVLLVDNHVHNPMLFRAISAFMAAMGTIRASRDVKSGAVIMSSKTSFYLIYPMHCLGFLSGNFLEQAQFNAVIPHIKKWTGLNLKPEQQQQQQLLLQPEPQAQKEDKVKEKDPILTCEEDELCKVNGEEVCTVPAELERERGQCPAATDQVIQDQCIDFTEKVYGCEGDAQPIACQDNPPDG